jgi:hypothetical protein
MAALDAERFLQVSERGRSGGGREGAGGKGGGRLVVGLGEGCREAGACRHEGGRVRAPRGQGVQAWNALRRDAYSGSSSAYGVGCSTVRAVVPRGAWRCVAAQAMDARLGPAAAGGLTSQRGAGVAV